ncbi:MAG TPA: PASTA domain-containing protein [Candidatus Hydrogenedentes bacterium]|nr:PASTA domain-containing protein [Candidatus Hydrogenedentota bacterium]
MAKHVVYLQVVLTLLLLAPIGGWAVPVTFNDTALFNAVKTQWDAATGGSLGDPPDSGDLANPLFTALDAKDLGITDLTGLEACTALTDLNLGKNQISDLNPLSGLTALVSLDLGFGSNPLAGGGDFDPSQTGMNLIASIAPLAGLVNLGYLSLMGNDLLTNIDAVASMSSLAQLWLAGSNITDYATPLAGVADTLSVFAVMNCDIDNTDMTAVNGLTNLMALAFIMTPSLTDISALTAINPSMIFAMMMVPVTDISVVSNYTNLQQLEASETDITSIPNLSGLTSLTGASFRKSMLTDISGLTGATSITELTLSENSIVDISVLENLTNLHRLGLDSNSITDIQALVDNTGLGGDDQVDLRDNPLSQDAACNQIPALQAKFDNPNDVQHNSYCGTTYTLTITVTGTGTTFPEPGTHIYPEGQMVYINSYPTNGSGWAFDHWGGAGSGTDQSVQITMDGDKTVEAVFVTPGDHTLTMAKTGAGSGNTQPESPGVYSYLEGRQTFVNANPNTGSFFGGWSGDLTGYNPGQQLTMDADKSVTADFTTSGYTLTVYTSGNGWVNFPTGQTIGLASGAVIDLEAYVPTGSVFVEWQGDIGSADPTDSSIQVTMDQNRNITALFGAAPQYQLTIYVSGTGTGSTDPAPGAHLYDSGQWANVTATEDSGSAFDHWEGDIGGANPSSRDISVYMDQDRVITAVFSIADWTLTIAKTGNGNTDPAPGAYGFVDGATVNINANLIAGGDAFGQWVGDLMDGANAQQTYQFLTMNQDRTLTAEFVTGDWTLTLATTGPGNVWPGTGDFSYVDGRTANFSANSNPSAYFAGWTGDLISDNPFGELVMDGNKSVTGNFEASGFTLEVTAGANGWVNLTGTNYFASGAEPVLEANPDYNYVFDEWTGDVPAGQDPNSATITVLMDQNRSLTANFVERKPVLTMIIDGTGSTNPAGAPDPGLQHEYNPGEFVWVSADFGTAGNAFSHWSGDIDDNDPNNWYLRLTMNRDRTVTAHYITADWTVTVAKTGNGDTWPNPGTYGFKNGYIQEFVANIYAGGDAFDHWEGLPTGYDANESAHDVTINSDLALTAVFGAGDYTLTTSVLGAGTYEYVSHPAGVYSFLAGREASMETRLWPTSYWGGFSGDVNSWETLIRFTMDGDKAIAYNFGTDGYQLTVNQTGGGSTTPSGTLGYVTGATPTVHAIATGTKVFMGWTGDLPGGADPMNPDLEIVMDQDRTLTAAFEPGDWYLYIQAIGDGTTDPAPGQYWYVDGQTFEATAIPGADVFDHWLGDIPEGQEPTSVTITGTMDQTRELTAVFHPATVTVPDLSGMTQEEADIALAALGLVVGFVGTAYNDVVPEFQIFAQEPAAGTVVAYGSAVDITVSLGICYVSVPDLSGLTEAEAQTALEGVNLTLGTVSQEYSETVPLGQVISQNPVYGLVVLCGTPVDIVISGTGGEGEGAEGEGEGAEGEGEGAEGEGEGAEGEGEGAEGEGEGAEDCHSADQNCDNLVNLSELLRVIQFFNSGGYHCQAGTEDGFAPGPGDTGCAPHASDYNAQDWLINLSELLRLIQFFNSGGYHPCPDGEDGFCPGQA